MYPSIHQEARSPKACKFERVPPPGRQRSVAAILFCGPSRFFSIEAILISVQKPFDTNGVAVFYDDVRRGVE